MYSNSANGAKSSWIVRTSTPKKLSVYDFDPDRPSTSFNQIASLPRLDTVGQSSSKPKGRKGSIIYMICEAIEAVGSPNKGASYIAIHKWITNNRRNGQTRNLRTFIRKAISNGLKVGLLKRSSVSKKAIGVQGYFIINEKYPSHNSKNSVVKSKLKIAKNVSWIKPNKVKAARCIEKPEEDLTPQSVLVSIMKTKDAFEEAAQAILQQASKVLEVATGLIETNSLFLNKIAEQNTVSLNPDVEMRRVVPMQSRQDGEATVASMRLPQSGQVRVAPMQSFRGENQVAQISAYQAEKVRIDPIPYRQSGEARVVPVQAPQNEEYQVASIQPPSCGDNRGVRTHSPQDESLRVARIQSQDEEPQIALMQFPLGGDSRVAPMKLVQGEARVASMQSVQGEARVAAMQSVQGEDRVAQINAYQAIVPIPHSQGEDTRVATTQSPQNEHKVEPMSSSFGVENQVVRTYSPQNELLQVDRIQSSQTGEVQVASVQPFQILGKQMKNKLSVQIVDSSVDQRSSPFQKVNTPQQELIDEELGVQRCLNFSLESSFGIEHEVSNLIHDLENSI